MVWGTSGASLCASAYWVETLANAAEQNIKVRQPEPFRWLRWGLVSAFIVGGVWVLLAAHAVLLPFVFAMVLAYLLAPAIEAVVRHGRVPRVFAILLVYVMLGLLIAAGVLYMVPLLLQEAVHVIRLMPKVVSSAYSGWNYWLARFHQAPMPSAIRSAITSTGHHVQNRLLTLVKTTASAMFGLVPGMISLIVSPVLAFYLLKDLDRIRERFWQVVPVDWQAAVFKLGFDIDKALNGFIRGQFLVAAVVGALSALWVALLGIPYAALIGVLAGITDVIPYVGPIVGAIPAILLGISHSPWTAGYAALGFIAIHQLEGTVIAPKLVGDSVGLHPLVVVFAILAGGEVGGFMGMLLGVPFVAVVKVVFSHLYYRFVISLDRPLFKSLE